MCDFDEIPVPPHMPFFLCTCCRLLHLQLRVINLGASKLITKTTAMKLVRHMLSLLSISLCSLQSTAQADGATHAPSADSAKIVFIRSTGFSGSATAFAAFIDDKLVCRLNNKRFSTHTVPAGSHQFSVQFAGKNSKEKAERIKINTEGGKTYYIQLVFQPGLVVNNIYCQEVTENSAQTVLAKVKEDTQCL